MMARKAALFGFLAVQAISIALWLSVILPFASTGKPLTDPAQQIWSGGGYSNLDSSFRSGRDVVLAPRFEPFGILLTGTILMVLAGVAGVAAMLLWRRSKIWLTGGVAIAALLLGIGGFLCIATHWMGDTAFPPGFLNADLLYGMSKAFITQFFIGFALFAVATVLVIAGIATRDRAFAFQYVAANWVLIAFVWLATYVACFVAPFPFGAE